MGAVTGTMSEGEKDINELASQGWRFVAGINILSENSTAAVMEREA